VNGSTLSVNRRWRLPLAPDRLAAGIILAGLLLILGQVCRAVLSYPSGAGAALHALAGDSYVWHVAWFSLWQGALSALLSVVFGVLLARAFAWQKSFPGRAFLLALFSLPTILPAIIAVFGIILIFGRHGWIAWGFARIGLSYNFSLYGLPGILIGHCFFNIPLTTRLLLPVWARVPMETWRLALQLGMGRWPTFRLIEWPMVCRILPGVFGIVFMLCFTSFAIVLTLGGGPRATTLEVAIYEALRFDFDLPRGALLALAQTGFCLCLALGLLRRERTADLSPGFMIQGGPAAALQPHPSFFDIAVLCFGAAFIFLPIAAVCADGVRAMLGVPVPWLALLRASAITVALGLAASLLATLMGIALGNAPPGRGFVGLATWSGVVVSPMILGIGLVLAMGAAVQKPAIAILGIVIMNAFLALPYAMRLIAPAMAQVRADYGRLSASLGLSGWALFRLRDWPLIRKTVGTAAAFASVIAMGDLSAIAIFGSQKLQTIALVLYSQMTAYRLDLAAITALGFFFLGLLLFKFVERSVGGRGLS